MKPIMKVFSVTLLWVACIVLSKIPITSDYFYYKLVIGLCLGLVAAFIYLADNGRVNKNE